MTSSQTGLPSHLDGVARRIVAAMLCTDRCLDAGDAAGLPEAYWPLVTRAARSYVMVLEREGKPLPPSPELVERSALLGRLFSGKDPLPSPPPLSAGSPWYGLIEDMGPLRCGVNGPMPARDMLLTDTESTRLMLEINGEPWEIVRGGGDEYLLRWRGRDNLLYRAWNDRQSDCWWIGLLEETEPAFRERELA